MGSISGVSPTATEMANSAACSQSPLVKPLTKSTTGTITSMKRMSTQETALTPFSKVLLGGFAFSSFASSPSRVSPPTATTSARALPLITLLPRKARSCRSVRLPSGAGAPLFSTGSLSPVSADWLTNRSRASRIRRSAGIMSPAHRCTRSPTAISSRGISLFSPARSTQAVVWSIPLSRAATLPLRVSCTKRSTPATSTMAAMMSTVAQLLSPGAANTTSVNTETSARASSTTVNGLIKAENSRRASGVGPLPGSRFSPYSCRRRRASSSVSPLSGVPSSSKRAALCRAAARSSRCRPVSRALPAAGAARRWDLKKRFIALYLLRIVWSRFGPQGYSARRGKGASAPQPPAAAPMGAGGGTGGCGRSGAWPSCAGTACCVHRVHLAFPDMSKAHGRQKPARAPQKGQKKATAREELPLRERRWRPDRRKGSAPGACAPPAISGPSQGVFSVTGALFHGARLLSKKDPVCRQGTRDRTPRRSV